MACDGGRDGFKQKERTQRGRDRIKKRQKDKASRCGCLKRGVEAFRAVTARRYCIFIRRSMVSSLLLYFFPLILYPSFSSSALPFFCCRERRLG